MLLCIFFLYFMKPYPNAILNLFQIKMNRSTSLLSLLSVKLVLTKLAKCTHTNTNCMCILPFHTHCTDFVGKQHSVSKHQNT